MTEAATNETETAPTAEAPPEASSGRFSAYDKTLMRFVGGVHDTKGDAKAAAKVRGLTASDIEVREV